MASPTVRRASLCWSCGTLACASSASTAPLPACLPVARNATCSSTSSSPWLRDGGRKGSYKDLTADCQQRFREINLHWHDLRHEYASRLVERNVPLAQVRDLLGHASIVTTERYDNQRLEMLQAAVARLEDGKDFDAGTDVTNKLSRIFQDRSGQSLAEDSDSSKEIFRSN